LLPMLVGVLAELGARALPWPLRALMLKPAFSGKALLDAAARVERSLQDNPLTQARADLRWLVSRPTHALDANLVAAAAIESLAENYVDSWLAPLLMYAACGTGGAYAYRVANTPDAPWGYPTPTSEYLGKAPPRPGAARRSSSPPPPGLPRAGGPGPAGRSPLHPSRAGPPAAPPVPTPARRWPPPLAHSRSDSKNPSSTCCTRTPARQPRPTSTP